MNTNVGSVIDPDFKNRGITYKSSNENINLNGKIYWGVVFSNVWLLLLLQNKVGLGRLYESLKVGKKF